MLGAPLVGACPDRAPVAINRCYAAPNSNRLCFADAHRGNGKRFVVHADEKLTAFLELEGAIRAGQALTAD